MSEMHDRLQEVIHSLRTYADDPMWADHAEVPKRLLQAAVAFLEAYDARCADDAAATTAESSNGKKA